jgi:putative transposase
MRGSRQWKWHLDEVCVQINSEMHYLWRAVDQEGDVLESYLTKTRDKAAALRFMKKALKRHGSPDAITTTTRPRWTNWVAPRSRRTAAWPTTECGDSRLPFRRRERAMLRFRQTKSPQKFASVHAEVQNHFNLEHHLIDRKTYIKPAAWPYWPSGSRSWPEVCWGREISVDRRLIAIRLTAPPFNPEVLRSTPQLRCAGPQASGKKTGGSPGDHGGTRIITASKRSDAR